MVLQFLETSKRFPNSGALKLNNMQISLKLSVSLARKNHVIVRILVRKATNQKITAAGSYDSHIQHGDRYPRCPTGRAGAENYSLSALLFSARTATAFLDASVHPSINQFLSPSMRPLVCFSVTPQIIRLRLKSYNDPFEKSISWSVSLTVDLSVHMTTDLSVYTIIHDG